MPKREEEELDSRKLLEDDDQKYYQDDDERENPKITIEEAVSLTGNKGLGLFQIIILVTCCMAMSTETLIFNFFSLYVHKPTIMCYDLNDALVPCEVDDYCDDINGTYTGYEIDWSKDKTDGTIKNWVTEYDLLCDNDVFMEMVVSLYFLGSIFGAPTVNWASEIWGRRPVLVVSIVFQIIFLIFWVIGNQINKYTLAVCTFVFGIIVAAVWQVSTVYMMEMTSVEYKSLFSNLAQLMTHIWFLFLVLLMYTTRNTIIVIWITVVISLVILFFLAFFACESPRFLFAHAHLPEAIDALQYMSRINGKRNQYFNLQVEELKEGILSSSISVSTEPLPPGPPKYNPYIELFASRKAFSVTMTLSILWGTSNFLYYGVAVNADSLRGSLFTDLTIIGIATSLGTFFLVFFGEMMGRKTIFGVSSFLVGLSFIVNWVWGGDSYMINDGSLLVGVTSVTILFTLIYLITVELFPTYVRSSAFGVTNVVGKCFAFSVPFWNQILGQYIMIVYIGSGILNLILTFCFEETRGLPLREDWDG